ncbi:hypothetical protein SAMN05660443_2931 [Marinospirillum celere]|uniref:Outer membrane protein beta-barrel domain-containing protein n=1 Tax=Marinospirillum celere TaxID=1122252 RepID=A0A1I1JT60_9GAMM|nr:hypothetical protein [Marinospirillum celere]SFC51545.1 hypothetical protein SAMN05660443_2931 [Marinospirillum celere]
MSKRFLVALLLTLGLSLGWSSQAVAATSHAFGVDGLRLLDKSVDDGQYNLSYQISVGRRSALALTGAWGDDYQVYEAGFKRYNEKYLSGTFFQLGAAYWRGDVNSSDLAFDVRLGYELPLTRHLVASAAVSAVYGVDHPTTGKDGDILFRPHLGLLFHF